MKDPAFIHAFEVLFMAYISQQAKANYMTKLYCPFVRKHPGFMRDYMRQYVHTYMQKYA